MTDTADASVSAKSAKFIEIWAQSLGQVLTQTSGSPLPGTALLESPRELPPVAAGDFWILCACSGGLRGEMSLRLPSPSATRLARMFMGEASEEPSAPTQAEAQPQISAEYAEAVVELFRQIAGLAASTLKPQWGDVQLRPESAPGPASWPASSTVWIRAGETSAALIEVHLSAALVAALRAEKSSAAAASSEESSAGAPPDDSASGRRIPLDLLLDVELALTLRFGSRSLPLSEILDLNPGSVIELDRQVEEPVDVLLDGRVVARGEVVVIDGNYGLRVTEVGPVRGA
jgi:flagellar motor switch protein FliN